MIPNCGILTESIKKLGKKHGITNEVYLKALYTRWATMHTNNEVFDDKALLEEMSLDTNKVDTMHLKEFGVIPSYTPISGEAPGGKISGVNKEGNIKLYKDSISSIEDFLKYISGKTSDSITSQQKKKVFEKLSKEGKDLRYFEDLLKSKKDILAFVLFHEKSHIAHRDIENYDVQDLLGDNQIEIEYRATLDAIEEFKAWKENESKKSVAKPNERLLNISVKNQIFDSEGNIRWDYFERILDDYHNNQPDSMFAKGRYTLATRPENHFEGEKNTLNHIKFVTQSMLDLFEGKFDADLPFVSEARASLKNQRDLMILAAMFHDAAKPYRHGDIHGWEAADIVRDVLGIDYNNRLAEWAVRHHMPMPFSHKAEFSLANPEAIEVAKNIARDAKRLGIDAATAINAFVLINAADVINGRELSVEDNWAKKAIVEGKTRYGDDISVKNVLTIELNEKVELLKQAFEEIKDEDLGDSKYNYENQERFDYIAFPEGGREDKKLPYLNNKKDSTQQLDELPEDIIIKPSPVNTDVISYNLTAQRAKLDSIINPNVQQKRAKLLANMFYTICDKYIEQKKQELLAKEEFQTVLEWESSAAGRAKALRYLDVKTLIEDLYKGISKTANTSIDEMMSWGLPKEVAEYRKMHYNIILDNFVPLLEDACIQIEKDCGLRLVITSNLTSDGKDVKSRLGGSFVDMSSVVSENPNLQDNEGGERTNGNDGWGYKARQTDPHSTISLTTKNILRRLHKIDENQIEIKDDLGNYEYLDEEYAHAMLISGLSNMINSSDFCVVTETKEGKTYEFPELEKLALKYPWVTEIIEHLEDNPEDIAAFYTDMRNTFIAYYKFSGGKLVSMNQASTNGSSVMIQIKRDYEQGNPLSNNPIYDSISAINNDNIKYNTSLLEDVRSTREYLDISDEEELKELLNKVVAILRNIGVDINYNDVNALWHLGNNQSAFNEILGSISTILSKAPNAVPGGLITLLNSEYIEIAKKMSKVSELENLSSFREKDKTYYSFSAPNFADIQIAYFKSDKYRNDYLTENFTQYRWFTNNEGNLREGWLKQIATNDYIRQNIDSIELKNIDGIEYEDWTGDMIDRAFIGAFFAKYKNESSVNFGYYHYPIFSDSPVAKFIKMVRYHGNLEGRILPLLREVVKQELFRIDHVNRRAQDKSISKIGNYDKVGRKFCFFPALNNMTVRQEDDNIIVEENNNDKGSQSFLEFCNEHYADERVLNTVIDKAMHSIMKKGFAKFLNDSGESITKENLKDWGVDDMTKEEALKEYYWNSVYAQTQIIQMTVTDLAFYKDSTDFQKRFKEVYASGKRLFTHSKYGKQFENVIYLADYVKTSSTYVRFKEGLTRALNEGRITKMDYDSILYKFKNINATDAQGFRTLNSYRAVLDMMGQWTPVMEDAVNKLLNDEWDISHFNVVWQTIKPFLFSTTSKPDGLGGIMKVNHQNKDSEFLLLAVMDMIAANAKSKQMKVLNQFMIDNNIDLALYESGCKAGKQGVIDLNYDYDRIEEFKKEGSVRVNGRVFNLHVKEWNTKISDIENIKNVLDNYLDKGLITQEEYNAIFENEEGGLALSEEKMLKVLEQSVKVFEPQDDRYNKGEKPTKDAWFNPNVVHTFNYEDYMIAQPTPEHLVDAETIFGSQFRNLIISDLPENFECEINGVKYNRKEVHDLYNSLIVSNIIDAFKKIEREFNDIHAVQRKLMSMVQDNPKFERDIIQALEIVTVTNPLTGKSEEVFNIPLSNPSTTEKLQQLILSAFKNGITKQYIKGGNAILVSDIGYTKELNVIKKEDGTLVGIECYLPATSKSFFDALIKNVTETDPKTGKTISYQILDFKELDDDLKEAIGYRIPTEHKYSMVPLIIKGFLPQQNGSSIMVAEDVTTLSGCDFDVDKMLLMLYNFVFDALGKPRKLKPRQPSIGRYEGKENTVNVLSMSKEERDNLIIDLSRAILTHPSMAWISSKPGSYDKLKRGSRVAQILENKEMLDQFKKQYNVNSSKEINQKFKTLPLLEDVTDKDGNVIVQSLDSFVKEHKEVIDPLALSTFKYFHRQNMTGGALVGIYANNTTMQAKYQETSLWLKNEDAIVINGKKYTNLTVITDSNGELVSFNCSETSAASVDTGKDPVLADLMQNKKTAKILGMLLRAGVPIDDGTMIFNLPNIRETIRYTGDLEKLKERIGTLMNILDKDLGVRLDSTGGFNYINSVKNDNITTEEIIDFIINYHNNANKIYNVLFSTLSKEDKRKALIELGFKEDLSDVIDFVKEDLKTSIIVNNYNIHANNLREITDVSRADSPNGAIEHTLQDVAIQRRRVDLLHMNYKKTTIQGLENVISNNFLTGTEKPKEALKKILSHSTPRLQAFYSYGIDLPSKIVGKYFIQTNPWMLEKTQELFDNAVGGILPSKVLKYFYNGVMQYCLSATRLFGTDSTMTFEEKRDWYIYEFPKYFINLRNKYSNLSKNHAIIQRLDVIKGKIEMERAGRLTATQRNILSNSLTSLLRESELLLGGNDVERELGVHLLIYAFHVTGLNFGPNNYGMFFNTSYYNQFPEYVDAIRTLQFKVNDSSSLMTNFMDQFYAIFGTYFTPVINSTTYKLGVDKNTKIVTLKKSSVVNKNIEQQYDRKEPYQYITVEYPTKIVDQQGNEVTISEKALFKYSNVDNNENVVYQRVGSIYDPFTGYVRFNANRTALEISKSVNSEETIKKAEEQKKMSYKRGVSFTLPEKIKDKDADLGAFDYLNFDESVLDNIPAEIFDRPDITEEEASVLKGNNRDLDNASRLKALEEIEKTLGQREEISSTIEDYGDFIDNLPVGFEDAVEKIEEYNLEDLSLNSDVESSLEYNIEEGNNELEKPMC